MKKFVLRALGYLLIAFCILIFKGLRILEEDNMDLLPILILMAISASALGIYLLNRAKQIGRPDGNEVLENDNRPPIIYLRSFLDDREAAKTQYGNVWNRLLPIGTLSNLNSEEEQLEFAVRAFGPFIAIGDPQEPIPQLGAHRIYAEHEEWQGVVLDLMHRSQLVILRVGATPGFWWEVETVIREKNPSEYLFLLPNQRTGYFEFKATFEDKFPITLPADYHPMDIIGQSFSGVLVIDPDQTTRIIYTRSRTKVFFRNAIKTDFQEILEQVLFHRHTPTFDAFIEDRSTKRSTLFSNIQFGCAAVWLGLLATYFTTFMVSGLFTIEYYSPSFLVLWLLFLGGALYVFRKAQQANMYES
ncbi:MAG: hypothetical protein AAF598_18245 [Bacteroidota bacterium]